MGNDLNKKKIRIYGDGQYLFTTTRHDTIKDAINAFKKGGDISVASIPGYKVNFNDYAKVTGEIVEELKEATDDRDGARYYIFDNSIGAFDDDYEEFDSKKDFLDSKSALYWFPIIIALIASSSKSIASSVSCGT